MATKFRSILDTHVTVAAAGKEAGLIPDGTWKIRAIGLKQKKYTFTDEDGDEQTSEYFILTEEPVEASGSVDPEEVKKVDPVIGQLAYAGRRLFTRFDMRYAGSLRSLSQALAGYGFDG